MAQDLEELIRDIVLEETIYLRHYWARVVNNVDPTDPTSGSVQVTVPALSLGPEDLAFASPRDKHSQITPKIGEAIEVYFMDGEPDQMVYLGQIRETTLNTPKQYKEPTTSVIYENPVTGDHIKYREIAAKLDLVATAFLSLGSEAATEAFIKGTTALVELLKAQANQTALKSALSSWAPIPQDGGAALKTALLSYLGLPNEDYSGILSTKIFGE